MLVLNRLQYVLQNDLFQPHPEAAAARNVIKRLIAAAMPFHMTDEVIELAESVASPDMSDAVLIDLFGSVELPAPITWVECAVQGSEGFQVPVGLFLVKTDNGSVLHITHFPKMNSVLMEPHFSIRANLQTGAITIHQVPHVCDIEKRAIKARGHSDAEATEMLEGIVEQMAENVLGVAKTVFHGLQLLNAKNSPLAAEVAEILSRQQRRAMERSAPGSSKISKITRIVLNAQGKAQIGILRAEGGQDARRRAHWVRGHLMRTETKGYVWRKCHVRGIGDPIMRDRVLSIEGTPQNSDTRTSFPPAS